MRLLLDSHAYLWWSGDPARLSQRVRAACADPDNELLVSVASIWELLIKESIGKLRVTPSVQVVTTEELESGGITLFPITLDHLWTLKTLPHHHRDPFDRMLIAQAKSEDLTLVSADPLAAMYGVKHLW